jgi:hypothetical protein
MCYIDGQKNKYSHSTVCNSAYWGFSGSFVFTGCRRVTAPNAALHGCDLRWVATVSQLTRHRYSAITTMGAVSHVCIIGHCLTTASGLELSLIDSLFTGSVGYIAAGLRQQSHSGPQSPLDPWRRLLFSPKREWVSKWGLSFDARVGSVFLRMRYVCFLPQSKHDMSALSGVHVTVGSVRPLSLHCTK